MRLSHQRTHLVSQLVTMLSAQPDIFHIHMFGREAEGTADTFSDIDIVVCSNDLITTRATYRDIISTISPIRATFQLENNTYSFSEMILLHNYSPYQKIDLTIGNTSKLYWPKSAYPLLVVYDNFSKQRESASHFEAMIVPRDTRQLLDDILFSVGRFTKCLFRRDSDMYRRWQSITNITLVLLREKYYGWQPETSAIGLGGYEVKALYDRLDSEDRRLFDHIRPPNAVVNIMHSYQTSVHLFIELSRRKAENLNILLDEPLITYIQLFLDTEIERYQSL